MNDRCVKILDILASNRKIKVKLLAEMLDISFVTLRKDLDSLEKRGIIIRTHGYAGLNDSNYTGRRMAISHSIKKRIAKAAAQIVEEGETVMLESGSCCALLAEELALAKKNVTIITNSVFIANYIYKLQDIKLILLGGYFQPESQVLVGPVTIQCGQAFFFEKFFMGANGFISGYGFTGRDHLRVETAAELAKRARKNYILTEAAKFYHHGAYSLIQLDKIAGVYTDDTIPKDAETTLIKNNVMLHKVPSADEKINWRKFPGQPPILYTEKES
ncbi:MAG: DeoR/GlpR family DNA-binding transcription regulator [Spirochaetes bacterium]|nr:DeoR/GlpR family DNA-binding transcription regulator [Brevinematales bacterium]MCL1958862.1 DeoR/GlpR family DNA-binding transcription regulator [Spirochaetota bacterium]